MLTQESLSLFHDWFSCIVQLPLHKGATLGFAADLLIEFIERVDRMPDGNVAAFRRWQALALVLGLLHLQNLACNPFGHLGPGQSDLGRAADDIRRSDHRRPWYRGIDLPADGL